MSPPERLKVSDGSKLANCSDLRRDGFLDFWLSVFSGLFSAVDGKPNPNTRPGLHTSSKPIYVCMFRVEWLRSGLWNEGFILWRVDAWSVCCLLRKKARESGEEMK